jgi:cupin 2 domain-containing protein
MVLTGAARLAFEDRVVEMLPGDSINIPAHTRHRVDWTTASRPWPKSFFVSLMP